MLLNIAKILVAAYLIVLTEQIGGKYWQFFFFLFLKIQRDSFESIDSNVVLYCTTRHLPSS